MKIKFKQNNVITSQEISKRFSILRTALASLLAMGIAILLVFESVIMPGGISGLFCGPLNKHSTWISQMIVQMDTFIVYWNSSLSILLCWPD